MQISNFMHVIVKTASKVNDLDISLAKMLF